MMEFTCTKAHVLRIPTLQGHPLQSTSMGMRKMGFEKVSSRFSRILPAQMDKEDIEDKDV